jgi:hypothetical protein
LGLFGSSWFGSWYAAGAKPVCMILGLATGGMYVSSVGLATGGMPVSSVSFSYRGETCELCSVLATRVRPVSYVWFWLQG